jgi:hypothetical protein
MTARSAATANSVVLAAMLVGIVLLGGCTDFYEIPIETPIQPKMDVSGFQRVLVAGFIAGGSEDVDANLETVRLLRSQLRTKSQLRVIEADALPLAEIATSEANKENAVSPANSSAGVMPVGPIPTANIANSPEPKPEVKTADPKTADPKKGEPKINNEKDLAKYDKIFADVAYWKKLGEEYQNPLIVTGTVLFTPNQVSGPVMVNREVYDAYGRRSVVPMRTYMERKGFVLQPRFVFIDGRTGAILYSETFHEERLYPQNQSVPALSSYFELMDSIIPSFLSTLSAQKIRGTRVLLK